MKPLLTCLIVLLFVNPAFGKDIDPQLLQELELTYSIKEEQRKTLIAQHMQLSPQQSQAFWPVYDEYRGKLAKVNERLLKLIVAYAKEYGGHINDAKAKKWLAQWLNIESSRLQIKKNYVKKFGKVLPMVQVTRFYQVDNKLEIIMKLGASKEIPLIGTQTE